MEKYNKEKAELINGKITPLDKAAILKDRIMGKINNMNKIVNCIKNEAGEYVHFVYDTDREEWVPLSLEFVLRKIKNKIIRR